MAAVALAWESQSTRRVGCSAVAKQAAKLTAVVVLPTPPFWFAQAMILAKCFPTRNLTNVAASCKLFHVKRPQTIAVSFEDHRLRSNLDPIVGPSTFNSPIAKKNVFHVKQSQGTTVSFQLLEACFT